VVVEKRGVETRMWAVRFTNPVHNRYAVAYSSSMKNVLFIKVAALGDPTICRVGSSFELYTYEF